MVNVVILAGNLCANPELRYTPAGTAVSTLRLAVNDKYTTNAGEKRDRVLFINVVCWGKTAENAAEYLEKGSKILVEGELRMSEWDDRRTGQKQTRTEVHASSLKFLSMKRSNGAPAHASAGPSSTPGQAPQEDDVPF